MSPPTPPRNDDDDELFDLMDQSLARSETNTIHVLRASVISVLMVLTVLVSSGVFWYTRNDERTKFQENFEESAVQIMESFHDMVERNMGAAAALSTAITSYATQNDLRFPYVTLPDFELVGSHLRAQAGSHIVHWMPVVQEEEREAWEEYALQNRGHIDEAYENDVWYRARQDQEFLQQKDHQADSVKPDEVGSNPDLSRRLQEQQKPKRNETVLGDGSGYHPKIWSNGGRVPRGDLIAESGPYLPTWQRSPIDPGRQNFLNMDLSLGKALDPGVFEAVVKGKQASLRSAFVPVPKFIPFLEANLRLSQYRENVDEIVGGLSTFLAYPVFEKLPKDAGSDNDNRVVGVLGTNVYWKILFSRLLPTSIRGIVCVVSNSYNQTFSYRIDGQEASFLGMGDFHDARFDDFEWTTNVQDYLQAQASVQNRAYTTVPLSDQVGYTVRVYPSEETEAYYRTNKPTAYTLVAVFAFALASILFMLFSCAVERRHGMMLSKVVENAKRAAMAERELNEFLSHEIRNPLSSALTACSFVSAAVNDEPEKLAKQPQLLENVQADVAVIESALTFINDFLRSMLDLHRADQLKFSLSPTDVLRDVFEPVSAIIYQRVAGFQVIVDCPENLMVMTDCVRLKQVVLNLARNSAKFVTSGFVRLRAATDHKHRQVSIYIEDSGPGIPKEKRQNLFMKYQESLDLLNQGTGIGLALSHRLMKSMGGDIWLDEAYHSGVESCPGACFVVQLNQAPLDIEGSQCSLATNDIEAGTETRDDSSSTTFLVKSTEFDTQAQPKEQIRDCSVATNELEKERRESILAAPVTSQSTIPSPSVDTDATPEQPPTSPHPPTQPPAAVAPVPTPLPPPSASPPTDEGGDRSPPRVLFVDDQAMVRKLFVRGLKRAQPDWTVQEASSGEMALRMCESQETPFDLIFLDQYMASVDKQLLGSETCHAMRSKGIKSVICGLSANDVRQLFIKAGANDFILKPMPCKPDELRATLAKLLGSTHPVS